eukprot:TRINITY_DN6233_c0_g1_i8.p1 TRINITY_DN6233_c0_g1~~TRINITY_DN6233_c0_g1_i8.p1  ORF type:complete len:139 (+),score=11.29 TRINITY_DN6233_c0_g1_i8:73-489(+)
MCIRDRSTYNKQNYTQITNLELVSHYTSPPNNQILSVAKRNTQPYSNSPKELKCQPTYLSETIRREHSCDIACKGRSSFIRRIFPVQRLSRRAPKSVSAVPRIVLQVPSGRIVEKESTETSEFDQLCNVTFGNAPNCV